MSLWLFLHLLGMALWLGGGFSAMAVAIASKSETRPALGTVARLQWAITRGLIFPGSLLTVVSGLFLTFKLMHGPAMGNGWLVTMQGLGILVALLALAVLVPNAAKLSRIDPMGEHAAYFDRAARTAEDVRVARRGAGAGRAAIGGDVQVWRVKRER